MSVPRPIPEILLREVANHLAVLAQPLRIRIIECLELEGEMSVQALADWLDASQQNVSRHLALLHERGVVERRPEGREVWYRLADLRSLQLLDEVREQIVARI